MYNTIMSDDPADNLNTPEGSAMPTFPSCIHTGLIIEYKIFYNSDWEPPPIIANSAPIQFE